MRNHKCTAVTAMPQIRSGLCHLPSLRVSRECWDASFPPPFLPALPPDQRKSQVQPDSARCVSQQPVLRSTRTGLTPQLWLIK